MKSPKKKKSTQKKYANKKAPAISERKEKEQDIDAERHPEEQVIATIVYEFGECDFGYAY